MIFKVLLLNLLIAFFGYILGRIGHFHINPLMRNPSWAPHHWIYGMSFIVVSFVFNLDWLFFSFGLGHVLSDLKDFIYLKIYGPDEDGVRSF